MTEAGGVRFLPERHDVPFCLRDMFQPINIDLFYQGA
jgi:hypothetical protein